jgi:hypothetical protein
MADLDRTTALATGARSTSRQKRWDSPSRTDFLRRTGVLEGETHAATDSHTKTERSADRETDFERCMISPVRGRRRLGDAVASKQWQRPAVSALAALRCAARPAAGYWALTLTCEPSYLTTWSGVAVTSRPLPWLAPTHTTLKVRLAGMPV